MSAGSYLETVHKVYLAYYGRPADVAGLAYWAARLDHEGGNLASIIEAFANSQESQQLYGSLSTSQKITKIYEQLFGRDPDPAGLQFYTQMLATGQMTQATIMLNVLDGAKSDDLARIDSDVNDAIGKLDQSTFNSLVEQYKATLHTESAADHSGATHDQALQTHVETQDHVTLVGVSDGTHPVDPLSV